MNSLQNTTRKLYSIKGFVWNRSSSIRLAMAIYEICSSVASILMKIRNPLSKNNFEVEDSWWFFQSFPSGCLFMAFICFVAIPLHLDIVPWLVVALVGTIIQSVLFYSVIYWNTYTPFQLVGSNVKFIIEVVPAVIAAVWHQFLVFKLGDLTLWQIFDSEFGPICLLLSCTTYFYLIIHFVHRAYDITAKDVIVGITMQVFCFMVCGELFIRVVVLFLCVSLSFYRYVTYVAPDVIPQPKRETSHKGVVREL
ncbi:hypothetical protein AABB24_030413 [Solanum stoloniferum]|uniref:Uncharacterized protein n=1 Tax=Solanum stoloniferum TaxID=62892 RepID=A0ABD2S201_9SOLN